MGVWIAPCLSVCPSVGLSVPRSVRPSVCLSVGRCVCLSVCRTVYQLIDRYVGWYVACRFVCPPAGRFVCLSVGLPVRRSVCRSLCLSVRVGFVGRSACSCLPVCLRTHALDREGGKLLDRHTAALGVMV